MYTMAHPFTYYIHSALYSTLDLQWALEAYNSICLYNQVDACTSIISAYMQQCHPYTVLLLLCLESLSDGSYIY